MYNIKSDNISYLVPLDHIDLGYLKRNIEVGDTVKPLWKPHQKEYSVFQLKAWRKDSDDEHLENYATITCHICNIEVPVIYMKEHHNSKKHKNFLRIINEALERVKNNTNLEVVSRPKTDINSLSTYFCELCSVIIPKTDKEMHENLISHQKMQKEDEIVENFATLFKKAKDYANDSNNNFVPKLNDVDSKPKLNDVENINVENKKATQLLQKYVDALKSKYGNASFKLEIADENFILIKVQGCTVKVHIDHFNSFSSSSCILCAVAFTTKEDHMWTEMHMKNVMTSLWDHHCIRQVNQAGGHCILCNKLVEDIGPHSDYNHKINLKHAHIIYDTTCTYRRTLVRQTVKPVPVLPVLNKSVNNAKESNANDKTYAQMFVKMAKENIPKTELNKHVTSMPSTNGGNTVNEILVKQTEGTVSKLPELNKNVNNTPKPNEINVEIKRDEPNDANSNLHYLMCDTTNPKELKCKVCLCVIPKFLYNVNDHLLGRNHNNRYNEYLTNNKLQKVQNGFACDYCRLHVPEMTEVKHVSSQAHNMETGIKLNMTYCEPCCIYLDTNNIESHRNGQKHKQKVKNEIKIAEDSSTVEGIKKYADVAATPKTVDNVQGNTESRVQPPTNAINSVQSSICKEKNLKPLSTSLKTVQIPESEMKPSTSTAESTQVIKTKLHYQLKETPIKTTVMCRVCNVNVPNTTDNISTHLSGMKHKIRYEELLKTNKVSKLQNNNFHCHKCDVNMTNKNELYHIFGNSHKNIQESDNDSAVSETHSIKAKNVQMPTTVNNQPSTSKMMLLTNTVQNGYKDKLYLFMNCSNPNELVCRVCNVKILSTPNNIIGHVNSYNHTTYYDEVLVRNTVFNVGTRFFCIICGTYIALQNELKHIAKFEHIDKIELYQSELDSDLDRIDVFCEFCSIIVDSGIKYEEHQISSEHVANIRKISNGTLHLQKDSRKKSKSTLKCSLCDCYVNNNYTCVNQHILGSTHKLMYNKLLDNNKICMVGDKLYCLACKDIIDDQQEFVHIRNPNHTGNLSLMS